MSQDTPDSYEPESLAGQIAPPDGPVADEGTEDLTEHVAQNLEGGADGAALEPEAEVAPADDSDLIESPEPLEPTEDLAGPQPMVAPVSPRSSGQQIIQVPLYSGIFHSEFSGLLRLASLIKEFGGSLDKARTEIEELLALPTPGNLDEFTSYARRVLRLARRWVGMTPDTRDDRLLNQVDRIVDNPALMALFASMVLDSAKPASMGHHEAEAVAQQFRAGGVSLENLTRLLAIVSELTALFRD